MVSSSYQYRPRYPRRRKFWELAMSACNGNNKKKGCEFVWQRNKGISINFENSDYHKLGNVDLPCAASAS